MALANEDLEMDLQSLMSCIECHKEERNVDVIIETLKTIVNICNENESGKDAFREVGGLDFLLQFVIETDQTCILECALKVLAFVIDGNVHSQMHLTERKVFQILQAIFKRETYPLSVLKNAVVFFSTLLFQNKGAQDVVQQNENLFPLITLYQRFAPVPTCYSGSPVDSERLEVWLDINSSLCFAVNNPLHEINQETCSTLFPISLKIVETTSDPIVIEATSSFLSLSIASNGRNQDTFGELDGFPILKLSLNRNFGEIKRCIRECNSFIRKGTLQVLNGLLSVISATVLDHEENASLCGKLGIISLMMELLCTAALDSSTVKKILLILGSCVDACSANRLTILEVPKLDVWLKRNLETDDEELKSAARYLLQVCLGGVQLSHREPDGEFLESCLYRSEIPARSNIFLNDSDSSQSFCQTKDFLVEKCTEELSLPGVPHSDSERGGTERDRPKSCILTCRVQNSKPTSSYAQSSQKRSLGTLNSSSQPKSSQCSPSEEASSGVKEKVSRKSVRRKKLRASQDRSGCVEVVVLPGEHCVEHKLAAHFELLRVRPPAR